MFTGASEARIDLNARYLIEITVLDSQSQRVEGRAIVARVSGAGRSRSAARALCHRLAGALYEQEAGDGNRQLQIRHEPDGSPLLTCEGEPTGHRISVSHSGDWVAVALSSHVDIGIDVERIDPARPIEKYGALLGWKGDLADAVEFYSRWTLWEACFKVVQGETFAKFKEGFDLLDDCAGIRPVNQVREWASFRGLWNDTVSYALVTRDMGCDRADKLFVVSGMENP